ncbi:MAG: hypothetical protein AAFR47_02675 [Pseudomonadota bacterium]
MLATFDHRFVLLSNPKTGTTALEAALQRHCEVHVGKTPQWKHLTYFGVKDRFGDLFDRAGCDYVTVIRDPIDTLHSWYRYRQRDALKNPRGRKHSLYTGAISFEQFVDEWAAGSTPRARAGTSAKFCISPDGKVAPAMHWRYDRLDRLVAWLEGRIGAEISLPRKNVSPSTRAPFDRDAMMALPAIQAVYDAYARIPAIDG